MNYKIDFDTEFNQFYICDKESLHRTEDSSFWSAEAFSDRLAIGNGILGVGIQSYGHVSGELIILDSVDNKDVNIINWDHVVEGGLKISSGNLQVLDCPHSNVQLDLNLKPGTYRVRIYSAGIANTDSDEMEGNDYYKIMIWPDSSTAREVLKRYTPS